jgi:hypothetical protein
MLGGLRLFAVFAFSSPKEILLRKNAFVKKISKSFRPLIKQGRPDEARPYLQAPYKSSHFQGRGILPQKVSHKKMQASLWNDNKNDCR